MDIRIPGTAWLVCGNGDPEPQEGQGSGLRYTGQPGVLRVRARPFAPPALPRVLGAPPGLDRPGFTSEAASAIFNL